MELVVNPQALIAAPLQHPIPGATTILYPGKGSVWQPVVTPLPSSLLGETQQVPKESIIANTDFTTTSLIAKRRLSSKKRKKTLQQQQQCACSSSSSGEAGTSESMEHSSPSSSGNGSPAVSSTTFTPPASDKSHPVLGESTLLQQRQHLLPGSSASLSTAVAAAHSSSTFVAVPAPGHSTTEPSSHLLHPSHPHHPHPMAATTVDLASMVHHPKQFANPVFSQMQQELNYRYLQEQSGVIVHQRGGGGGSSVVHPQPHSNQVKLPATSSSSSSSSSSVEQHRGTTIGQQSEFKWCRAHITIARQIQQHQQRSKAAEAAAIAVSQAQQSTVIQRAAPSRPLPPVEPTHTTLAHHQHLQQQQQQQQQLALLQMYGVPTNTTLAGHPPPPPPPAPHPHHPAAATSFNVMALPYPMHEVQLMQTYMQLAAASHGGAGAPPPPMLTNSGVALVKPVPAMSNNAMVASDPSMMNFNPSIQVVNGVQLHHTAPYGHLAPPTELGVQGGGGGGGGVTSTLVHGSAMTTDGVCNTNGSWVAQGVPVFGSCIVNPLQPGIMATQWVK